MWSLKFQGETAITSSSDGTVKVWQCGKQEESDVHTPMQCQRVLLHRGGEVWSCDMTTDSIFSGGRDTVAKIWDRETGLNYMKLEAHRSSVFKIHAGQGPASCHSVLTCGGDGLAIFWDMRTGIACSNIARY
jgi:WD40 repeat protein